MRLIYVIGLLSLEGHFIVSVTMTGLFPGRTGSCRPTTVNAAVNVSVAVPAKRVALPA